MRSTTNREIMAKKKQHDASENPRGVKDIDEARQWLNARGITEIECVVPDQAGVARGKIMPVSKFLKNPTMACRSRFSTRRFRRLPGL